MIVTSVNQFRAQLKQIVDSAMSRHEPVRVTRKSKGNFIVVSEEDWNAEQETLYVLQNKSLMKQIAESLGHDTHGKQLTQEEIHEEFDI